MQMTSFVRWATEATASLPSTVTVCRGDIALVRDREGRPLLQVVRGADLPQASGKGRRNYGTSGPSSPLDGGKRQALAGPEGSRLRLSGRPDIRPGVVQIGLDGPGRRPGCFEDGTDRMQERLKAVATAAREEISA